MLRRSISALIGLSICLVLLAGCGSSSKTSSTPSTPAPSGSPAPSSSSSAPGTSSTSLPASATPSVKAAVEQCKSIIRAENKLPAKAKAKLEGACAEAAKGNTSIVKRVAQEVCEETINNSSIPQAAKEHALGNCKKS